MLCILVQCIVPQSYKDIDWASSFRLEIIKDCKKVLLTHRVVNEFQKLHWMYVALILVKPPALIVPTPTCGLKKLWYPSTMVCGDLIWLLDTVGRLPLVCFNACLFLLQFLNCHGYRPEFFLYSVTFVVSNWAICLAIYGSITNLHSNVLLIVNGTAGWNEDSDFAISACSE